MSSPTQTSGVLAGQVLDRFNRRPGGVYIRVVDLQDTRQPPPAPIEKQADDQGYFTIVGLRPGGHYQLIARVQDGDHLLSGSLVATPPNPRLSIWVSEDTTTPSTPPLPANPVYPGRPDGAKRPAASLEPPVKDALPPAGTPNPADARPADDPPAPAGNAAPAGSTASPAVTPDPTRTADGNSAVKDGFQRLNPPPPKVEVPSPAVLPPPPGTPQPPKEQPPPASTAPGPTSRAPAPAESPPVPSCQLVGRRLVNLALYDQNGNVWEYRKNRTGQRRTGRLVLIDFWHSHCGHCLEGMRYLAQLNSQYGPFGLELVGIAYETGTIDQQVAQVRSVRGRYGIRYPTLLGAGSDCPVRTQFDVQAFPTLVLLDENGDIVMRKEGLDERGYYELVFEIRKRLGMH